MSTTSSTTPSVTEAVRLITSESVQMVPDHLLTTMTYEEFCKEPREGHRRYTQQRFVDVVFTLEDCQNITFNLCHFEECSFPEGIVGKHWNFTIFEHCSFVQCRFVSEAVSYVLFSDCYLDVCRMGNTVFERVHFNRCRLSYCHVDRAAFPHTDFGESTLIEPQGIADFSHSRWYRSRIFGDFSPDAAGRATSFERAAFTSVEFPSATLRHVSFRNATLHRIDFDHCELSWADFTNARLRGVSFTDANLSGAKGLPSAAEILHQAFEHDEKGIIVYKQFGTNYEPPSHWQIKPDTVIEEVANPDRSTDCGSGIHVSTPYWQYETADCDELLIVWRCRIEWIDLADVIVPWGFNGKIRCRRLTLLDEVVIQEGEVVGPVTAEARKRIEGEAEDYDDSNDDDPDVVWPSEDDDLSNDLSED